LPKFQGKCFGKAQVKEVLRRLKQDNFKKAFVRTGEHLFFTSAQKMYVACGFKELKRHSNGDQSGYGTIDYEIELK
jgi:GNAT superfamily N-acetyltransferase